MIQSEFKVLLISDDQEDIQTIQNTLFDCDKAHIPLDIADTPAGGLENMLIEGIDVILFDLCSPGLQGFEILKTLNERAIALPVIVLIGPDSEDEGIRAINEGAYDYLFKDSMDRDSLIRSIRYAVEICRLKEELRLAGLKINKLEKSAMDMEGFNEIVKQYRSAAHDLNQPLTALLGSICLMKIEKDNRENISHNMERIEASGKNISGIVNKIQAIGHEKINYLGGASLIMNHDNQKLIPNIEATDNEFKNLNNLFKIVRSRCNRTAA